MKAFPLPQFSAVEIRQQIGFRVCRLQGKGQSSERGPQSCRGRLGLGLTLSSGTTCLAPGIKALGFASGSRMTFPDSLPDPGLMPDGRA